MVEKNIHSELRKYFMSHRLKYEETFTCEVKLCKMKRFDFARIEDHQLSGLLQSKQGLYHKLTDAFLINGRQAQHRPFDFIFIKVSNAYVCVCFYIPRKKKICYFIEIEKFLELKKECEPKKSCHEEDFQDIADFTVNLLKK